MRQKGRIEREMGGMILSIRKELIERGKKEG